MNQGDSYREAELQTLLKEERDRCTQYKEIYQDLKVDHGKLEAELESINNQLREVTAQHEKDRASDRSYISELENRIKEKENEIITLTEKSERLKLIMQKDVLQREFTNCQEHRKLVNKELQEGKREAYLLQGKLAEAEHKCQLTITNLHVEMERWKAEQESEKEHMAEEMSKIKMELNATVDELNQAQQVLLLKEQEYQQNLMVAKQQLWKQTSELSKAKDKLERKLLEIESDRAEHITMLSQELQTLKQNLQTSNEAKLNREKEIFALKNKLDEMSKSNDNEAYTTLAQSDQDREILHLKLSWEQQKLQFHQKLEELESQLKETRHIAASEKQQLEQKTKKYTHYINKLKEKNEILKAQNGDLEAEKTDLRKNVPIEVHLEVKNELEILKKRIEEYRRVVSSVPGFQTSYTSAQPVEKLLADIKNLQFPTQLTKADQSNSSRHPQKISPKKRGTHSRRRSSKIQSKDFTSLKASSPVISSSSDIDLENL
ncbi:centrosomal protein of 83 kDa-like [Uloborus diversus]|uniref:centrosomal protein of 83 kDa-like n=1 Tax=Uloborus diversus TaxID=327109 RepID=UPI0024093CD1|nr:centrosomal protein of 83 kDa-like [Uloborus diversus]